VILRYLKWPDRLHYEVAVVVLEENSDGLWLMLERGAHVDRGIEGSFAARAPQVVLVPAEEMWTARWFRREDRGRGGRADRYACYVDVTTTAMRRGAVVELVDLDLDVVRTWDDEVVLLDEDEFTENMGDYPPALVAAALQSADELATRMLRRMPPFDGRHRARWAAAPPPP
jgi:hypothetical protein